MKPKPARRSEPLRTTATSCANCPDPAALANARQCPRKASNSACTVASAYATLPGAERLSSTLLRQ
eukprot:3566555-Alexandrium_andersonii.AAC.1